jgi:signal transduction histidine kinase
MTDSRDPSPLAGVALSLVGEECSVMDLVSRFADLGVLVEVATAESLIDELRGEGLVRVGRGEGTDRVYVPTSLAQRVADKAVAAPDAELLRDLERMRTDLLSTVAHELRTPLTAVMNSVGLLRDPHMKPSAEQREALLEAIERNAVRMRQLVNDILDLTRFREGRIQLQLRQFDAVELARAVVASFPDATERMRLDAGSVPIPVVGDRRRLEHALVNLVSNARKYSDAGSPVEMSVGVSDGTVSWTVTDHGIGIPMADRSRLFERFFVGRNDTSAAHEGVGLGLPIALAIVQAHDGWIDVDSQVDVGSRFTISVPAAGPAEAGEH